MGTFELVQLREALTTIRWPPSCGNKDWDIRMKEYTSFKTVITDSVLSSGTAAADVDNDSSYVAMCPASGKTHPGFWDSGLIDQSFDYPIIDRFELGGNRPCTVYVWYIPTRSFVQGKMGIHLEESMDFQKIRSNVSIIQEIPFICRFYSVFCISRWN